MLAAVEIARGVIAAIGNRRGLAPRPAVDNRAVLEGDRDVFLPFDRVSQNPTEDGHRTFAETLECDPDRVVPIDRIRNFLPVLAQEFLSAVSAGAHQRPEGHINENTIDVVGDNFADLSFGEGHIFFVVGARPPIAPAVLATGCVLHPPGRMIFCRLVVEDGGVIGHRVDALAA